jgi:methyl-accepting chemotaxis protein
LGLTHQRIKPLLSNNNRYDAKAYFKEFMTDKEIEDKQREIACEIPDFFGDERAEGFFEGHKSGFIAGARFASEKYEKSYEKLAYAFDDLNVQNNFHALKVHKSNNEIEKLNSQITELERQLKEANEVIAHAVRIFSEDEADITMERAREYLTKHNLGGN